MDVLLCGSLLRAALLTVVRINVLYDIGQPMHHIFMVMCVMHGFHPIVCMLRGKEIQIVYRLFIVNCYLLHVPRLFFQPVSSL